MSTSNDDLLAGDGDDQGPRDQAAIGERAGDRIGRYELLQEIGEGGFGVVWMAEQTEPVRRRVALKVIKVGMDTRQVVARFEAERQALALMDHPNIARVLDGGATDRGRPYFVMELVQGAPIVEFCDGAGLGISQRLELMADVCRAVQHAHSKGIIHRDIKPSNVLVGHQDGRPRVKVIDFGIAKATGQQLTEKTLFTEHRQVIGTLQYMSPEQAEGSLDIDTRTDVYSLGVLLYELLAGSPPFEVGTFQGAMMHELQRIIREVDPPKPSTRLSESEEVLARVAARRGVEPRRLGVLLRGELDWIVMKALEKDRSRRYETASGLAEDLRRYLDGEAVDAAPPGAAYRLRKALRRHRGPVAAAVAVFAALGLGLAGFAWQAGAARDQRDRAVAAETEARMRADDLAAVAAFQSGMLEQVDVTAAGRALTEDVERRLDGALEKAGVSAPERAARSAEFERLWARVNATDAARELIDATILRPAVLAVEEDFEGQPAVRARLRQALADRYRDLGLFDAALPLQEAALRTRREIHGEAHVDTLVSCDSLGLLRRDRGENEEAEALFRSVLEVSRSVLGGEDPATLDRLANLGSLLASQGRIDEAEPIHVEVLELQRRIHGPESPEALTALNNLAYLLDVSGRSEEAEPMYREALAAWRRVLGDEHPDTLSAISNLAVMLLYAGRLDDAEPLFREALEGRRRAGGEDHPETLASVANLGALLKYQGELEAAEPYYLEALEKRRSVLGPDHPDTLVSLNNLAGLLWAKGDFDGAEQHYAEALERKVRVLGGQHPSTVNTVLSLGDLRMKSGHEAAAVELLESAEADVRALHGERQPGKVARLLVTRGRARTKLGELDGAEVDLRAAESVLVAAGEAADSKARTGCTEALAELAAARAAAIGDGED